MHEQKVIMMDSDEAASIQTLTGWVSANGRYWANDERMARYEGATHQKCPNNPDHPIYEVRGYCRTCREERLDENFKKMPVKDWEGEPLVIYDSDRYFFDDDSLWQYLYEAEIEPEDVRLCICTPNYPSEIDPSDHFCDDLPEDGEINDDQLIAAFDLLNEMIRKSEPMSWSEGDFAASLPQSLIDEIAAARVTP